MNVFAYARYVIEVCANYDFIKSIDIILLDEPVIKIKATVNNETFISIFYNSETQKYSFTLIRNNKRIFGMDNTKQWHIHPFEDPDAHLPSDDLNLFIFLDYILNKRDKWI